MQGGTKKNVFLFKKKERKQVMQVFEEVLPLNETNSLNFFCFILYIYVLQ